MNAKRLFSFVKSVCSVKKMKFRICSSDLTDFEKFFLFLLWLLPSYVMDVFPLDNDFYQLQDSKRMISASIYAFGFFASYLLYAHKRGKYFIEHYIFLSIPSGVFALMLLSVLELFHLIFHMFSSRYQEFFGTLNLFFGLSQIADFVYFVVLIRALIDVATKSTNAEKT